MALWYVRCIARMGEIKTVYKFFVVEVSFKNLNPECKNVILLPGIMNNNNTYKKR
jgi:hypothetical protein